MEIEVEKHDFLVKDCVGKRTGYQFPGIVVACFHTTIGGARYVVECTAPGVEGCLHVFSNRDLILRAARPPAPLASHPGNTDPNS